ncbi:MAG TPA: creatininase family protein [Vicinamibacterales bacterium]|jgi:creatinine amidohydrolase|nr:creatininase family protein [Vicinamibacterales bacterium]
MSTVWLHELTSDDVESYLKRDRTILVPIGATETHGPHLPLGTDTFEAMDYAEGIARAAGVLVTPPIWFGDSPHHMGRPGTISIASQTLIDLLKDVYRSLIHHGFTRIVTFNGHRLANLPVIQIASKQVKEQHPDVLFACFDPLQIAAETHKRIRTHPGVGVHACEFETSHMLFRHPDLVHPDKFTESRGTYIDSPLVPEDHFQPGDRVMWITTWRDQLAAAPSGHHGDPTEATVEKGQALWDAVIANGVAFIEAMRRFSGARHAESSHAVR